MQRLRKQGPTAKAAVLVGLMVAGCRPAEVTDRIVVDLERVRLEDGPTLCNPPNSGDHGHGHDDVP